MTLTVSNHVQGGQSLLKAGLRLENAGCCQAAAPAAVAVWEPRSSHARLGARLPMGGTYRTLADQQIEQINGNSKISRVMSGDLDSKSVAHFAEDGRRVAPFAIHSKFESASQPSRPASGRFISRFGAYVLGVILGSAIFGGALITSQLDDSHELAQVHTQLDNAAVSIQASN